MATIRKNQKRGAVMGANASTAEMTAISNDLLQQLITVRAQRSGFSLFSRHHQETLWRATDLRLLYSWFAVTSDGGRFRWKHWCAQLDHSGRLPLEFVSRAWLLGLALGTGADMAHVAKHGLDAAFKPLQVSKRERLCCLL
jgi:hypothetical protein